MHCAMEKMASTANFRGESCLIEYHPTKSFQRGGNGIVLPNLPHDRKGNLSFKPTYKRRKVASFLLRKKGKP